MYGSIGIMMALRPSVLLFFFSSRRLHTRFSRDWSSDVCSSDLLVIFAFLYPLANLLSISVLEPQPTREHYQRVAENPVYARVLFRTLQIALLVSLLSLALSLPVAVLMASSRGPKAIFLTACILLPFWSSVLVRTAAWAI